MTVTRRERRRHSSSHQCSSRPLTADRGKRSLARLTAVVSTGRMGAKTSNPDRNHRRSARDRDRALSLMADRLPRPHAERSARGAVHREARGAIASDHQRAERERANTRRRPRRRDRRLGVFRAGPGRDERFSDQGELWGLDSHPTAFSTGVGHALISAVELALSEDGFSSASLWALDGNARSASFYERHGWSEDGNVKLNERPDMTLFERRRTKSLS